MTTSPAAAGSPKARWEPALWSDLPGWTVDDFQGVRTALNENCRGLRNKAGWASVCVRFAAAASSADLRAFIENEFNVYHLRRTDAEDKGLITGYYEPLLMGSRTRTARFNVPLYAKPSDLVTVSGASEQKGQFSRGRYVGGVLVPYFDRARIESNPSAFTPIAWVDDVVEAFFLQIQGSGLIDLGGGQRMRVGFADHNGHAFKSIGRVLIDRSEMRAANASMQGIKAWVAKNPSRAQALLNENPRYVFFREIDAAAAGPLGALGVPLTGERSMAVDTRFIPLGTPVYLASKMPNSAQPLNRLMFAQDVGSAIRGVVRGDFYWGTGAHAGDMAGRMKQNAQMWVLWPKAAQPPASVRD